MKYVYLPVIGYVNTWVRGGYIPLRAASTYLSSERVGTKTPDECKTLLGDGLTQATYDALREVAAPNVMLHGRVVKLRGGGIISNLHHDIWDGLILCLSHTASEEICRRLGSVACIAIDDVDALYQGITRQLGVEGEQRACSYTEEPKRDVFTKAVDDAWQQEYRMFWPIADDRVQVLIPPNTGRLLWRLTD